MSIRNFLLLLVVLIITQGLSAKNPSYGLQMPRLLQIQDINCTLPAPSGLYVTNVGPGFVDLSWTNVAGASQYRVVIRENTTGNTISTTFFPGTSNDGQVSTAGTTQTCHAEIWSVCSDGSWDQASFTESNNFDTIIVEIITSGWSFPNYGIGVCPVDFGIAGGCDFIGDGSETPFKVTYMHNGQRFIRVFSTKVVYIKGECHVQIISMPQTNQNITYYISGAPGGMQTFVIKFRPTIPGTEIPAAELGVVATATGEWTLYKLTSIDNSNCLIEKTVMSQRPSAPTMFESGNERDQTPEAPIQLVVKPNPFHNVLTVQLPESTNPIETNVRLYDLIGSEKRTYTLNDDQRELNIITTDLTPGVYFLRVESGGKVETVKVVKTQ